MLFICFLNLPNEAFICDKSSLICRISQLTQMYEETRSKLESKELELKLELEARQNREMQIIEMEDTLNKETERAQDLKVSSFFY